MNKQKIVDSLPAKFPGIDPSRLDALAEECLAVGPRVKPPRHPTRAVAFQAECLARGFVLATGEVGDAAMRGWVAAVIRSKSLRAWLEEDADKTLVKGDDPAFVEAMLSSLGRAALESA